MMEINGQLIREVWQKANPITGQDEEVFRLDIQGNWIRKKDFNNADSIYGWTIYAAHENDFSNIQSLIPLHTHNNPIPLAGNNHPTEIIFGEKYI